MSLELSRAALFFSITLMGKSFWQSWQAQTIVYVILQYILEFNGAVKLPNLLFVQHTTIFTATTHFITVSDY